MLKKLRFLPIVCAAFVMFSIGVSAEIVDGEVTEETRAIAYQDISRQRSTAAKDEILKAREEVAHTESWVADGAEAQVVDMRTGEVLEELPEFHDIFPEDWDIPVADVVDESDNSVPAISARANVWRGAINIPKAGSAVASPALAIPVVITNNTFSFYPTYFSSSTTTSCNVRYTNADTGWYLAHKEYLSPYTALIYKQYGTYRMGVGVSTHSNPGFGSFMADIY